MVTSILVTDIGDGLLKFIGDGFGHFSHQHPISFYKSVKLQDSKMSPITKISHQYWKGSPSLMLNAPSSRLQISV